jgi:TolB-like protein/DNA-binding winged helix-turn-helix (wHTH) protein/Flp pilus assembly protein TadD
MTVSKNPPPLVRFGPFAANLKSGELWKEGVRIRLQIQPFQILSMLLDRPNELVTREELQRKLWPSDTFVDFDHGLNKAINKLRDALCDTAEDPRFIETIPRRGYRFIAPVAVDPHLAASPESEADATVSAPIARARLPISKLPALALTIVVAIILVGLLAYVWRNSAVDSGRAQSVAVLPLLAPGASGDYDVADGITDSIINDLSLVPNLRVISHASVFQYRGRNVDPRSIGRELGVTSVLTGSVVQAGTNITVNLELTATSDGRHLWGQQYNRRIVERVALQHEAAGAVANALRRNLSPARRDQISRQTTTDAEAQLSYLKGRNYFFKETPEDVLQARGFFQDAIDRDPTFALAWGGLGDSYDWMATEGFQPLEEVVRQSAAAKSKANEINDSLAEIHASIAALEFAQWNWAKAELEFQRALQINPNYFEAHKLYSIYLRTVKRFPEAIQHATLGVELNPLSMPAKSHLALTYYYARQYDAAAEHYRLIAKEYPQIAGPHGGLSAVLLRQGKEKEAIQEWQKAFTLAGDQAAASSLGETYAHDGLHAAQTAVLRAEMQSLTRLARSEYVSPLEFAYRCALLGDKENAFRWLEKAYAEHSPQLFNLNVDPDYDNLREDARFTDLLARLHLPR